jgi:hypothetical protein
MKNKDAGGLFGLMSGDALRASTIRYSQQAIRI